MHALEERIYEDIERSQEATSASQQENPH